MSFGNSIIYPFPAVQYIPLPITTVANGKLGKLNTKARAPLLLAESDLQKWRLQLGQEFGVEIPSVRPKNSFPLLGLNCLVEEVKYRGFFVTMVGKVLVNHYHFFYIPKTYFYKQKLFFELYDSATAKRIARYSLFNADLI